MRAAELWNERVPWHLRQRVTEARLTARRRVDRQRVLPAFLIIGTQRGGTSSLYKWLEAHPDSGASLRKEVEYFSHRFDRGPDWYRSHFPSRLSAAARRRRGRELLAYEASPYYLAHPLAPARAGEMLPDARIVALLRDPVERAVSHHAHMVRVGLESLPLGQALDAEAGRLAGEIERIHADPTYDSKPHRHFSYVTRGRYAEQLERWFAVYPRRQMLILRSEDLFAAPAAVFAQVLDFVGLRPFDPSGFANFSARGGTGAAAGLDPGIRRRLHAAFRDEQERLAALLGRDMGWEHGS